MSNVVSADKLSKELFIPVQMLRDVRKASMNNKKDEAVKMVSPLGFLENIPRSRLLNEFRRLDGRKIKLMAWKGGQEYLVTMGVNSLWFAVYVPADAQVGVAYPDGSARVANKSQHERGDYVVCPSTGNGEPDMSRLYIVSNSWFHRMFKFTRKSIEATQALAEKVQSKVIHNPSVYDNITFDVKPEPRQSEIQPEGVEDETPETVVKSETEPRMSHRERVARAVQMEGAGWSKVVYPDIYGAVGDETEVKSKELPVAILKRYVTGSRSVAFLVPSEGLDKVVPLNQDSLDAFERKYKIRGARAVQKIVSPTGTLYGMVLSYGDGTGTTELTLRETAMLARLGLIDNLALRTKNGRSFIYGKGGTKVADLPAVEAQ